MSGAAPQLPQVPFMVCRGTAVCYLAQGSRTAVFLILHRTAGQLFVILHRTAVYLAQDGRTPRQLFFILHRTAGQLFVILHRTAGQLFVILHRTAGQLFVILHRTAGQLSELRRGTEWRLLRSHGSVFAVQRWALAVYIACNIICNEEKLLVRDVHKFCKYRGAGLKFWAPER